MSGWGIAFWFADLIIGGVLIGYGLHLRQRYNAGWIIFAAGVVMEIAFIIYGPEIMV